MIDAIPRWLVVQKVPLYAFLLALLTNPSRWAGYAKTALSKLSPRATQGGE